MQATLILRNDHNVMKGLFLQVQASKMRAPQMQQGVLRELFMLLEIHMQIEEQVFYPALEDGGRIAEYIEDCHQEHRDIAAQMKTLQDWGSQAEDFDSLFSDLVDTVRVHFESEETELFPVAEKLLESRKTQLDQDILDLRQKLQSQPQYQDAQPEVVQDPGGGEQKRKPTRAA